MREILAVLAVVLGILVIYTVHQDRVKKAADEAQAAAEAQALARSNALKRTTPTPAPDRPTAVRISRLIESQMVDLIGPLDQRNPVDLVPPLQILKERVIDKKLHADKRKLPVYDQAVKTLDVMISIADERTTALDNVLRVAARPASTLDSGNSITSSNGFFLEGAIKRWESNRAQRKAVLDQAMAQLRTAERDWNKIAGENAFPEDYDFGSLPPVLVKVEAAEARPNPLERGAYNQRRQTFTWRRAYYDQYNPGSMYTY